VAKWKTCQLTVGKSGYKKTRRENLSGRPGFPSRLVTVLLLLLTCLFFLGCHVFHLRSVLCLLQRLDPSACARIPEQSGCNLKCHHRATTFLRKLFMHTSTSSPERRQKVRRGVLWLAWDRSYRSPRSRFDEATKRTGTTHFHGSRQVDATIAMDPFAPADIDGSHVHAAANVSASLSGSFPEVTNTVPSSCAAGARQWKTIRDNARPVVRKFFLECPAASA